MRKGRKRRKSSASSKDLSTLSPMTSAGSAGSSHPALETAGAKFTKSFNESTVDHVLQLGVIASGDEADTDRKPTKRDRLDRMIQVRDFEKAATKPKSQTKKRRKGKRSKSTSVTEKESESISLSANPNPATTPHAEHFSPPIGPAMEPVVGDTLPFGRRPFNIRHLSLIPALPRTFSSSAPFQPRLSWSNRPLAPSTVPQPPVGLRRTSSLPERLNQQFFSSSTPLRQPLPYIMPVTVSHLSLDSKDGKNAKNYISRTTAILLLLVSTGLVALCANFLIDCIGYLVANSGVSEAFVGLIILPIVGNAAEHVTAVTVAAKNKMDLAIGVAVGSSIQIGECPAVLKAVHRAY